MSFIQFHISCWDNTRFNSIVIRILLPSTHMRDDGRASWKHFMAKRIILYSYQLVKIAKCPGLPPMLSYYCHSTPQTCIYLVMWDKQRISTLHFEYSPNKYKTHPAVVHMAVILINKYIHVCYFGSPLMANKLYFKTS